MKILYENWIKFLLKEEEGSPAEQGNYLATPKTTTAPTISKQPAVSKDPKKDPINNPNSDQHGTFVHIMSDEIENQLLGLEKSPDGTTIIIDLPKYLNALYPTNLFPGGWQKVWVDAQKIRKNKAYGVGGSLYWRPKPLKISKNSELEGRFGVYKPAVDTLFINFPALRKADKDPLQTIVHELGHCINDGPSAGRLNAEAQMDVATSRGYGLGRGYRVQNLEKDKKNIYDELSNLGQIILPSFKKERPEQYEKVKDMLNVQKTEYQLPYVLSRSESQQRYYRPMKFWFAKILQRIKKEGKIQRGEIPNLGDPNYYVILQSYATPEEYENLAYQIEQATKGTPVPEVRDYIVEKIRNCKQDPKAKNCIMNRRGIYPEIVSTVKTEPQQSTSQVA